MPHRQGEQKQVSGLQIPEMSRHGHEQGDRQERQRSQEAEAEQRRRYRVRQNVCKYYFYSVEFFPAALRQLQDVLGWGLGGRCAEDFVR